MSKIVDIESCIQCLASLYINPNLFNNEKYHLLVEDFTEPLHKVIFSSLYNLYSLGAVKIDAVTIEKYLEQRDKANSIFKSNDGLEWLSNASEVAQPEAFDFYYHRMKKMTILRVYNEQAGLDVSDIYDIDNLFDAKKKQKQIDWLDNHTEEEIAQRIDDKIAKIKNKYVDDISENDFIQVGAYAENVFNALDTNPDFGYPLYGKFINTIFRGARLGKFYLRSAPTNVGKSRAMIADACNIAFDEIYDTIQGKWVNNGTPEPTIYITTEQKYDEVSTMVWSFLSGVPEDHILEKTYTTGEIERVKHAIELTKKAPLYIKELPDFSLSDIESTILTGIREFSVKYCFLDYIHSSMKILSEISSKAKVQGLREDNILFLISVKLKDIAVEKNIFILSSTQLNGAYVDAETPDQNLLRGAKSIADKIDIGSIMLRPTTDDITALKDFCNQNGIQFPNMKISIYKNRRGRFNHIYLWCNADLSTCRINGLFATEYDYKVIEMNDTQINYTPNKWQGAF